MDVFMGIMGKRRISNSPWNWKDGCLPFLHIDVYRRCDGFLGEEGLLVFTRMIQAST
jgi:hypothetical protein